LPYSFWLGAPLVFFAEPFSIEKVFPPQTLSLFFFFLGLLWLVRVRSPLLVFSLDFFFFTFHLVSGLLFVPGHLFFGELPQVSFFALVFFFPLLYRISLVRRPKCVSFSSHPFQPRDSPLRETFRNPRRLPRDRSPSHGKEYFFSFKCPGCTFPGIVSFTKELGIFFSQPPFYVVCHPLCRSTNLPLFYDTRLFFPLEIPGIV